LENSFFEPALKIGQTFAIFNSSGKLPEVNELFRIADNGSEVSLMQLLTILTGMLSYPELDLFLKESTI